MSRAGLNCLLLPAEQRASGMTCFLMVGSEKPIAGNNRLRRRSLPRPTPSAINQWHCHCLPGSRIAPTLGCIFSSRHIRGASGMTWFLMLEVRSPLPAIIGLAGVLCHDLREQPSTRGTAIVSPGLLRQSPLARLVSDRAEVEVRFFVGGRTARVRDDVFFDAGSGPEG